MQRIMIIRHAEKPIVGGPQGVDDQGAPNDEELIVKGWMRSGALGRFFAPVAGAQPEPLATPRTIFASAVAKHSSSLRPQHTVGALVALLGDRVTVDFTHPKGDEPGVAKAAVKAAKEQCPVLIAWEHENIPAIVAELGAVAPAPPAPPWPDDRFDVVWVFSRASDADAWKFEQVPQLLLSGDRPNPI